VKRIDCSAEYGETKLEGEKALQAHCPKHLIFRPVGYMGKGNNFETMLRLAKERQELSVINDQVGAPTGAELLADCTAHAIRVAMMKPEVAGLYHLVASNTTTWYDYAALVFDEKSRVLSWLLKSLMLFQHRLTQLLRVDRKIHA
jgi:dTDP-4-dehydrorhamnose reductase